MSNEVKKKGGFKINWFFFFVIAMLSFMLFQDGIGADTVVKAVTPSLITTCKTAAIVLWAVFAVSLVLWIVKKNKFKKSEAYTSWKEYKKSK